MHVFIWFVDCKYKRIAYKVEKIPQSSLQVDEILDYFHLQVNDALKCTCMLSILTHYIHDISKY